MLKLSRATKSVVLIGAAAIVIVVALDLLMPTNWSVRLRELGFDQVLAADSLVHRSQNGQSHAQVIVVDIDRRSLEAIGPWPWPHVTIAKLVAAIAAAKPAVVALDILFAEQDSRSPAALARQLGMLTDRPDFLALADTLPDGDQLLASIGRKAPLVFGFVLDPEGRRSLPHAPILVRNQPRLDSIWKASGAVAPITKLTTAASGLGALSLPAESDGVVRYVPLLVAVGDQLMPGLSIESVRVARGASSYLLQSNPLTLTTDDLQIPLSVDALLRLIPKSPSPRTNRTVSAVDILNQVTSAARLNGATVLIGGSAPELGGLRQTVSGPLVPSVQIQADAIEQINLGRFPRPVEPAETVAMSLLLAVCVLALFASIVFSPLLGALALAVIILLAWFGAVLTCVMTDRLIDPLTPSLAGLGVFAVASITSFAATRRREALVRRRFEQHLAPAVVRRIVDQPTLLKLTGERREVTSLFTDVEGFTAMTHRADAEELVTVLDHYFEGITKLVVEHGGMVDKIVGDAVHALFNVPLDLDDHPCKAVACAVAIRSWTESHRRSAAPQAIGLGRTRIGIETGEAIVGDVGLSSKLDYTAYGDAVNAAARFEAANKDLASSICIGPTAAARCDPQSLRPLGNINVRGRDEPLAVYEPWPADWSSDMMEQYRAAFALIQTEPTRAAEAFEALTGKCERDPVPSRMADRIQTKSRA
jgi:adenylate cyclase